MGPSVAVPGQWQNFLRVNENKEELFSFPSTDIIESVENLTKELVVTLDSGVLTAPPRTHVESLAPCCQEEADGRIFLHAADVVQRGNDRILIRTVDTDVVLAVTATQRLCVKIWLVLPMFHALTGCDTVSAFAGRGKRTAWMVWESFPELTKALSEVNHEQTDIPE